MALTMLSALASFDADLEASILHHTGVVDRYLQRLDPPAEVAQRPGRRPLELAGGGARAVGAPPPCLSDVFSTDATSGFWQAFMAAHSGGTSSSAAASPPPLQHQQQQLPELSSAHGLPHPARPPGPSCRPASSRAVRRPRTAPLQAGPVHLQRYLDDDLSNHHVYIQQQLGQLGAEGAAPAHAALALASAAQGISQQQRWQQELAGLQRRQQELAGLQLQWQQQGLAGLQLQLQQQPAAWGLQVFAAGADASERHLPRSAGSGENSSRGGSGAGATDAGRSPRQPSLQLPSQLAQQPAAPAAGAGAAGARAFEDDAQIAAQKAVARTAMAAYNAVAGAHCTSAASRGPRAVAGGAEGPWWGAVSYEAEVTPPSGAGAGCGKPSAAGTAGARAAHGRGRVLVTALASFAACLLLLAALLLLLPGAAATATTSGLGRLVLRLRVLLGLQRCANYLFMPLALLLVAWPAGERWLLRLPVLHFSEPSLEARYVAWSSAGKLSGDAAFHAVWFVVVTCVWVRVRSAGGAAAAAAFSANGAAADAALPPSPLAWLSALALLGPLIPTALLILTQPGRYLAAREPLLVASRACFTAALLFVHSSAPAPLAANLPIPFVALAQLTTAVCATVRLSAFVPMQALHLLAMLVTSGGRPLLLHAVQLAAFGFCLPCLLLYATEVAARRAFLASPPAKAHAA